MPPKTPGNPSLCPANNCRGCEHLAQCRTVELADPENIKEAYKDAEKNSKGSLAFETPGLER